MKRILILGAAGMAGHMIHKYLVSLNKYKIYTSARNSTYLNVDFKLDIEKNKRILKTIINHHKFDAIINCIGILIKEANNNYTKAIYINSYFPHWLENITKNTQTKIIQLSTDCVFSGKKGNYSEIDIPDAPDYYGRSKALGEIINNKDLTIRLSIIGTELKENGTGLMHWFLNEKGTVKGFIKAYWNGITTLELAKALDKIINKSKLTGLYHLAPDFKINKHDLLQIINKVFKKNIQISPIDEKATDKTLINNRRKDFNYKIPNYEIQIKELYEFTK